MNQITMEWINDKIGALYVFNMQLIDEIKRLTKENEELKAKIAEEVKS